MIFLRGTTENSQGSLDTDRIHRAKCRKLYFKTVCLMGRLTTAHEVTNMSRDIPDPIKRILRQEAGFGCCICGHPFIEYHHIVPYSEKQAHDPSKMMVFCPIHHHQANIDAIDVADQFKSKKKPFNILNGYANGQLIIKTDTLAIEVGSNQMIGEGFKFIVDDRPLLQLQADKDNRLTISLDLYNLSDELLISMLNNEWISGDPLPWDIQFGYNWLQLREKYRQISLEIDARNELVQIKGNLWFKKQNFIISSDDLRFNGVVSNVAFKNLGLVGMYLAADTFKNEFSLVPDPRFGSGMIVSWPDPKGRLRKGLDEYKKLDEQYKSGKIS